MNGFLVVVRFYGYDIPASLHANEDEAFAAAVELTVDPELLDSTLKRLGGEWEPDDYDSTIVIKFVDGKPLRPRSIGKFADLTVPEGEWGTCHVGLGDIEWTVRPPEMGMGDVK